MFRHQSSMYFFMMVFSISIHFISGITTAQDIHFSQFYISPLYINPAMAGFGETEYRVNTQYRSQWAGISNPYKTMQASGDIRFFKDEWKRGYPGLGIAFYSDKAGKSKMGTTEMNVSFSHTINLDDDNTLSGGMQFAYVQKSIDVSNLRWDNQYNGVAYDPSLPTGENIIAEPFTYMDMASGFMWNYKPYDEFNLHLGISGFHLLLPKQSYFKDNSERLNMRFVLHGGSEIKLTARRVYILPKMLLMNQGGAIEFIAGGLVKYMIGMDSKYTGAYTSSGVSFGGLYRWGDALSIQGFFDYRNSLSIGMSYDLNLSDFNEATNVFAALEISLAYRGNVFKDRPWKKR